MVDGQRRLACYNESYRRPWRLDQNYAKDLLSLRFGKVEDGAMEFSNPEPHARKAA